MRSKFEQDKEKLSQISADHLREIQEKFVAEKSALSASVEELRTENELLKSETGSLIDSEASLSLQLKSKESEVLHLRSKAAEADFYKSKCRETEDLFRQVQDRVAMLTDDIQVARQDLMETHEALEHARKANEAHAMFSLAVIKSGAGSQKVEALQLENDNLRHQLSSLTELLDNLETGIKTTEATNSAYVKSYAQMQQQIERLVGHNNNKQRIQYVGKLQTENRELKEEQAKLRSKVDSMQKKVSQLELQLRSYKENRENRPETVAGTTMSMTHSKFY